MKVLLCHNHYQQPGGEDESFAAEAWLLEARGHQVLRFTVHNREIDEMGRLDVARRTIWNDRTHGELTTIIARERPDIMHCTNTFPLISPAAYYAARAGGVPVVQSLRNYRMLCLNAFFLRDGRVCEDCLGKSTAWPGVAHACYRGSRAGSAVVATMLATHRLAGTWRSAVDQYFAVSQFTRDKFVEAGWPADRLMVKPNFVHPDPGAGPGSGSYAVFVGRLSPEKGIETLLDAWRGLEGTVPLKIVGDGPLADRVQAAAAGDHSIQWLGRRPTAEVLSIVGDASLLVMPSIWYETFGRTIIEAFAKGTPVVASRLGAMSELVADGRTGRLFEPGNASDLVEKVRSLVDDPQRLAGMRLAARVEYLAGYTADRNYDLLTDIYRRAQQTFRETHRGTAEKTALASSFFF